MVVRYGGGGGGGGLASSPTSAAAAAAAAAASVSPPGSAALRDSFLIGTVACGSGSSSTENALRNSGPPRGRLPRLVDHPGKPPGSPVVV